MCSVHPFINYKFVIHFVTKILQNNILNKILKNIFAIYFAYNANRK